MIRMLSSSLVITYTFGERSRWCYFFASNIIWYSAVTDWWILLSFWRLTRLLASGSRTGSLDPSRVSFVFRNGSSLILYFLMIHFLCRSSEGTVAPDRSHIAECSHHLLESSGRELLPHFPVHILPLFIPVIDRFHFGIYLELSTTRRHADTVFLLVGPSSFTQWRMGDGPFAETTAPLRPVQPALW